MTNNTIIPRMDNLVYRIAAEQMTASNGLSPEQNYLLITSIANCPQPFTTITIKNSGGDTIEVELKCPEIPPTTGLKA